jgi:regulator of protease activity HflC (stomatin/prohibitin superfamily)
MSESNIIIANLARGKTYVTASRYMEDYGQVLKIEGIDLPSVYQVDFSNSLLRGTSKTVHGNADGVAIPDEYISTGRDVYAFLYITGDMWGRTIATIRIPNKTRPKRTSEIPTPTQQSVIDQTIAALNDAVESTAADAEQTASDAARAEAARTAAETAEANAEASATAAAQSEANAAQSESTATAAATSASASAASAYADAERAEQAANTAGYLDVEIVDGRLIYTRTDAVDVDFALNNGRLIMEAI